jgi:hypothetical protein
LGPFLSKPKTIFARGQEIWAVEPDQHRVARFDRSGRLVQEYRELNRPTEIAVDDGFLVVVEAAQTQLSKFSLDGRPIWRTPRFQGLSWILPEAGTGAGWVGAQRFEGQEGGAFRYDREGKSSSLPGVGVFRRSYGGPDLPRLSTHAIRSSHGQLYIREDRAIVILAPDGTVLKRVDGFRYATEQRVRN